MLSSPLATTARGSARILLVDDEAKLRASIAEGLRLEDWHVLAAANGQEALTLIRSHEFDLLVLDWMLPDLDGMEVLRRARALAPRLPVLMVTARCTHMDEVMAFQAGVTDYIVKPFAFADLVARSRALLAPARRGPA